MSARLTAETTWTLRLPQTAPMTLNHRPHWRVKAAATRGFRDAVNLLARQQRIPGQDYIRFQLRFQPGTRHKRDVDNLVPTSKACLDGLRDAGVIPDDSPEWVDHLMPSLLPVVPRQPALFVVITSLDSTGGRSGEGHGLPSTGGAA